MRMLPFGWRVWLPAGGGGDIDLWDFPAVPFSQQLCSSREAEVGVQPPQPGYFNQGHGSPLASPATRGFCRLPGGCPRPGPLSQAASGCPHRLLCCGNVVLEQQTLQELQQESWRLPRSVSKCKFSCGVQAWHRTEISSVYTSTGMLQTEFPGSLSCWSHQILN